MNELVILQNDQAITTSLKIAEVFGKRHNDVLRAIENAISTVRNFAQSEKAFEKSSYVDSTGKNNPMYYLNRDAFSFVVMGFTGEKAAEFKWKYIQAFNAMEQKIIELLAERKYTNALQKNFGIEKGTRDTLPVSLLYELDKGQSMAAVVIKGLAAAGKTSKEIFSGTKQKIADYVQLSLINQRFLGA